MKLSTRMVNDVSVDVRRGLELFVENAQSIRHLFQRTQIA